MRTVISLCLILMFVSCVSNKKEADVLLKNPSIIDTYTKGSAKEFNYNYITSEKLQEFYELLLLEKTYPEFKDDIALQIKSMSSEDIKIPDSINVIAVKNVKQIGPINQISNTVQEIKLSFDVVTNTTTYKDSIYAKLTTNRITKEGSKLLSTKITFSKSGH